MTDPTTATVRSQYEALPYPQMLPDDVRVQVYPPAEPEGGGKAAALAPARPRSPISAEE